MNKLFITFILILSSCTITQEIFKCELMQRGEKCLSDHRCCNPPQAYYQTRLHWNKPIVNKTIIINKPINQNLIDQDQIDLGKIRENKK